MNLQKEINRRNKLWKSATKAERKILVAKDVLAQIKKGKFVAKSQMWAGIPISEEESEKETLDTQKVLLNAKKCECCAIGSVMLSCIAFKNSHQSKRGLQYLGSYAMIRKVYLEDIPEDLSTLKGVFSKKEIREMEMAFECGAGANIPDDIRERKISQMYEDMSDKTRLIKIMENVIEHGGFKP